ncbi:MAG: hypothetical protein ABR538_11345 [Candidatus Binatia bacterium]
MHPLLFDPVPSPAAIAGFTALSVAMVGVAVAAVGAAARTAGESDEAVSRRRLRVGGALVGWLAFTTAVAATGIIGRFDILPPPLLLLVGATFIASTLLAFSRLGSLLAGHLPLAALIGFQAFRLPLELILHQLSLDGVLPVQMTYDGMNWDIATGISAALLGAWAAYGRPPRFVLVLWNVLGLVLLLTIVTIAILSSPVPFRVFLNEPANVIVTTKPFVWLPTFLVPAAWIGHLLLFRRLRIPR